MPAPTPVSDLLARLPLGWSEVRYRGRRWSVTRSVQVGGRSQKVLAHELGGTGLVSANVYVPDDGVERFRPCEMPAEEVVAFLEGWVPVAAPSAGGMTGGAAADVT
ncbi:peptide methionine sulfoxide reductase [Nocardioides bruguierae]|uniref:Peptide methionine sulfoxide reductase n=1 Tax=Nocardioides bruguierae TaxID=2945102 RepID=A0A9X2D6R9_9ACTN|nr:peptide methionine sulfoxide reductase [Nocardioides bruguierae]MCM0620351.1 peptide methionine sulfoxide reductase [Nocardioides bruguierae]